MSSIPVFCGKDCGGNACPMLATVVDGRVTRILHNPAGGRYLKACRRGFNLQLETYAPDRLLHRWCVRVPRGSGQFRQAGWDEALQITADRLGEIRAKYGPNAVLSRGSAGVIGAMHATYAVLGRFLNLFGGCARLTMGYSNAAASYILPFLFGDDWTRAGFDAATMQQAEMIILWGANVLETRQGTDVPRRVLEAKKRGAQIVVIDPRRSATVKQAATWWIPCRPGTDAALMLALLHVLFSEGLGGPSFHRRAQRWFRRVGKLCDGANRALRPARRIGPPRSAAWRRRKLPVLPAPMPPHSPAMLFPGFSIQRVFAGEDPYRLTVALQIATANFGRRGGSTGAMNNYLPGPRVGTLPVSRHICRAAARRRRSCAGPTWFWKAGRGATRSDIHAVHNVGSNLINQGSDIRKSIAAFEKLDFAVSHEHFMTPTARLLRCHLPGVQQS